MKLAAAALALLFAVPMPNAKHRWTKTSSDGITIYSETRDSTTVEVATRLAQMRAAIARLSQLPVRSPYPTNVYVFRNEDSFAPFAAALLGEDHAAEGIFLGANDGNYLVVRPDRDETVGRVVYHELAHYFLRNSGAELPLWFNEGVAELYSTFTVTPDEVRYAVPMTEHLDYLREHGFTTPLRDVLAAGVGSRDYHEAKRAGAFYAESWVLVHYLLVGEPSRRAQLQAYLESPSVASFEKAFGMTTEEMTAELRNYVKRPRLESVHEAVAKLDVAPFGEPVAIEHAEVLYVLGELLERTRDPHAAAPLLEESIRLDPNRGDAYAALAKITDDRTQADALLAKALAAGSHDYRTFQQYGEAVLARIERVREAGGDPPQPLVKQARDLFAKSIELNPDVPRPYAGLGATYLFTRDDAAPGIAAFEKSLAIAPQQLDVASNLIFLYSRARRRADAKRLFETTVAPAADAAMLAIARDNLIAGDVLEANDLLMRGRKQEALDMLRAALPRATSESMKNEIRKGIDRALAPPPRLHP